MKDIIANPLAEEEREELTAKAVPRRRVRVCSWLFLIPAALVSTAVGRGFTAMNPQRDAHLFAYIGSQWLQGRLPYLDVWDNKPPGIYAINALVLSLFPGSFTALAVMEGIFILGCVATVYFLMRRWRAPREIAILAAAAACVACNLQDFNELGNYTEIYLLGPAVLSMYWFTRSERSFPPLGMFLAGVFAGAASLFKPVGLAPVLAQAAFLLFLVALRRLPWFVLLRAFALGVAGIAAAWAPFVLYFWRHGALWEMVYATLLYPMMYGAAGQSHLLSEPFVLASRLLPVGSLVVCALAGMAWFAGRWNQYRVTIQTSSPLFYWPLAILWVLADLAGALAGGQNWPHYFLCLAPSLSVMAGLAVWSIVGSEQKDEMPAATRGFALPNFATRNLVFALVLGPLLLTQARDVLRLRNFYSQDGYVDAWVAEGLPDTIPPQLQAFDNELQDVSAYLNRVRKPGDTLFSWVYLPTLFFNTGMRSPTRPLDAELLTWFWRAQNHFGKEILRDLRRSPPTFIVDIVGTHPAQVIADEENPVYLQFQRFVRRSYEVVYQSNDRERDLVLPGDLKVYRLISPPGRAAEASAENAVGHTSGTLKQP